MRRNVLRRAYDKIKDWALGVEEDDTDVDTNDLFRMKLFASFQGTTNQWSEFDTSLNHLWAKAVPAGPLQNQPMLPVLTLRLRPLLSHVAVWLAVEQQSQEGWTVMVDHKGSTDKPNEHFNGTLFVNSEELKQKFLNWWSVYIQRFGDIEQTIPTIKDGMRVSGLLTKTPIAHAGYVSDDMHSEWCWIVENCGNAYLVNSECWLFEDDNDAVMYKLSKVH